MQLSASSVRSSCVAQAPGSPTRAVFARWGGGLLPAQSIRLEDASTGKSAGATRSMPPDAGAPKAGCFRFAQGVVQPNGEN